MRVTGPKKRKDLNVKPPCQNMQLQSAAKLSVLCCHLANKKTTRTIPPFTKLLKFLQQMIIMMIKKVYTYSCERVVVSQ